jgi:type I restriction enzyme, S subunit
MVPEGWRLSLLDSVTRRGSGHTPNKNEESYWGGGIKWVSLADSSRLDKGQICETDKEISEQGIQNSSAVLHPSGTVVLSRDAGVGKSAVLAEPMAVSQHFIAWRCDGEGELHNWFLYYWLQFKKEYFERMAVGSTIKTIGLPLFKKLEIEHPCYTEQKKIAEILSTWDKAIDTTEKLLSNAEKQKRALMEQLLTGNRRLKGFGGEWIRRKIGSLLNEVRRTVEWSDDDTYRLVSIRRRSGGAFLREELIGRDILTKTMRTTEAGDFLISKMQVVHGAMAMTPPNLDNCHISGSYISLVARNNAPLLMEYFDWLSRTRQMYRKAFLSSYGVHIEKMTFNLDWFFAEQIALPATVAEQAAIVEVLNDANACCARLSLQRAHLIFEKRALMQQLLTGKRRVSV